MDERTCEMCGLPIPAERLEVLPETRVCVGCAAAMGGSEFDLVVSQERTSKATSYKHNYGAVGAVEKLRKPITQKRRS